MSRALSSAVEVPADVETTWRALTGPAWPQALAAELHDDSRLLRADPDAQGGLVLVVSRRLPEGGPAFLQSFLPKDGRVTQTDSWGPASGGVRRATWRVDVPGAPGRVGGEMTLEPAGAGTRWSVQGSVQVKVPLLGGRIEGFVAPLLEKLVVRQGEVLRALV